ncbi:hypothetical protein RJ639_002726 [Escallonia herrerae]|uniref:Uncharacterized protein n=1 Tax=Escallonia herrerae TaxID=1293975 RepID=A0AA89AV15_9ASTE|nr:hypothetical protein RJ639_002726 [Escallonia herrerae]
MRMFPMSCKGDSRLPTAGRAALQVESGLLTTRLQLESAVSARRHAFIDPSLRRRPRTRSLSLSKEEAATKLETGGNEVGDIQKADEGVPDELQGGQQATNGRQDRVAGGERSDPSRSSRSDQEIYRETINLKRYLLDDMLIGSYKSPASPMPQVSMEMGLHDLISFLTHHHFLIGLVILLAILYFAYRKASAIYLLDHTCYRPPNSNRIPMFMFIEHACTT